MRYYSVTAHEYVKFAGSETKYFCLRDGFQITLDAANGLYLISKPAGERITVERWNILYGVPLLTEHPPVQMKPLHTVQAVQTVEPVRLAKPPWAAPAKRKPGRPPRIVVDDPPTPQIPGDE